MGRVGRKLRAKAEHVCHAGEDGDKIPGGYQPCADISRNSTAAVSPESHHTDISAQANDGHAHQEYRNLNEPDYRAAIQTKDGRAGAHQENKQADQCDGQPGANSESGWNAPGEVSGEMEVDVSMLMLVNMSADGAANSNQEWPLPLRDYILSFPEWGQSFCRSAIVSIPAGTEFKPNPPSKSLPRPTCRASPAIWQIWSIWAARVSSVIASRGSPFSNRRPGTGRRDHTYDAIAGDQPFDNIIRKQAVAFVTGQQPGSVAWLAIRGPSYRSSDCRADNSSM